MTANHLAEVKAWFERTEASLNKGFYATYPLNEFWKKHNTPQMHNILRNAENDAQALELIQGTYFFVVKLAGAAAEHALQWQWHRLSKEDPQLLAEIERVGESSVVPHSLTLPHQGKRYSVDIFRIGMVAQNILRYCNIDKNSAPVIFELGAGLGHLARFVMHLAPKAKYIISDLPISLCFSYLFLKHNFPEKRICLLEADGVLDAECLAQYDVVLAPPSVMKNTRNISVDAFVNTCSLGEMDNTVSSQWLAYIENTLNPAYAYSLNRFLNHIDGSADFQWRTQENAHLAGVGPTWDVVQFQLEDEKFFSPFLACIHPRYLELVLKRRPAGSHAIAPDMEALASNVAAHASISLYPQHGWAINYYGAKLNNDLSMQGELFAYWNAARVNPGAQSFLLLMLYLDRMNRHCRMPFEETKYLEQKLAEIAKSLNGAEKALLQKYLGSRNATMNGPDNLSVVERNKPVDVLEVISMFSEQDYAPQKRAGGSLLSFAKNLLKPSAKA